MTIKDKVILWYLKKIYLPKREIFNYPGFILENLGKSNIYLREIAIPEDLIVEIENKISSNITYRIGKKFGWYYALSSKLPRISTMNKKNFFEYAKFLVKYMESVSYGENLNEKIDYDKKIFELTAKNYIICSKNGRGYIFGSGGISGIWAWVAEDKTIEGIQEKCCGRGNNLCKFTCAPIKILKEKVHNPIKYSELDEKEIIDREYLELNKIRSTKWAKSSLKNLIDSKFVEYKHGQIIYNSEKFCLSDCLFMYILENEIKNIKNGEKILWNICYNFGKKLAKISHFQNPEEFIKNFFPAMGFGDIFASKKDNRYEFFLRAFPWNNYNINFILIRGILSGLLSEFIKRKIKLKLIRKNISSEDGFSIILGN